MMMSSPVFCYVGFSAPGEMTVQAATRRRVKKKYVRIAPISGKKYHYRKNCRGLRRAKIKKRVTISYAKRHHYKKCKLCWGI